MNKIVTILTTGLLFVATSVFSQLTFTVSPQPITGNIGDVITVDVTVANFQNVLSTQYSFAYDPSILQFDSASNPDMFPFLSPAANISNPSSGAITLAWFDNTTVGITQPDGTRFFSMQFTIIDNVGADTRIMFSNTPTILEIIDGAGDPFTFEDNELFFNDGTPGGALDPANSCTDNDNDGVCVADDCDDNNAAIGQVGSSCDDGDANTTNDRIQSDCSCSGTAIDDGNTDGGNTNGGATISNCTPPASGFALIGSAEAGDVGDVVCVQITSQDFDNVLSMQYSMSWDPAVLRYSDVQNTNLAGLSGAINGPTPSGTLDPGSLGVGWADPMATGVTVADGTILYEVCFTVLAAGSQEITFGNAPVPVEVVIDGGNTVIENNLPSCPASVNFAASGGGNAGGGNTGGGNTGGGTTVTCTPPASGFALIGSAETGDVGDVVCVQITAQDFDNVLSMQYSMSWDPAVLRYSDVQNTNLAGLSGAINGPTPSGTLNPGSLGVGWADPMATGITVADGTILYEVCFTVLASGEQEVTFGNAPVPVEIVLDGGNNIIDSMVPSCPATVNFVTNGGGDTGGGNTGGGNTGGGTTMNCTPPASGFALIGSAETGNVGDVVCVQITAQDFDNVLSMQYSMSWDPAVLRYSDIQNTNLAGLSGAINGPMPAGTLNPGTLGVGWADPMATGVTVADGTVLYEVCFTVLAGGAQEVTFGNAPVPVEIVLDGGNNIIDTSVPSCPATVNFESNPVDPVEPVNPVTCTPPASGFAILGSAVTGNVGDVVCVEVSTQEFNNIVGMQYSMNWDPTVLEYANVQGFNLSGIGASNFSSPNPGQLGLLWTDPNVSGVTVTDGTALYEVCFTILTNGTAEIDFTGTPVPIEVTDGDSNPVTFQSCAAVVSQPTTGGGGGAFAVIATDQMAAPGSNVCIPVTVNDFSNIVSMQYSMGWDPAILTYTGVQGFNLAGLNSSNFNSTTAGSLGLTWLDPNVSGLSVMNGTVIYEVCFDVNANATVGSTSSFNFSGSPVPIEVQDGNNNAVSFSSDDATVTIVNNQVNPVDITVSSVAGTTGDIVCVPVNVNNFDEVLGFQFSMNWDPTVLMYSSTGNYGLPGLSAGQFGTQGTDNGLLTFAWIDNTTQGVSLLDGSTVFEVCFEVIGAGGSSSSITIGNTPTPIEITRAGGGGAVGSNPVGGTFTVNDPVMACPAVNPGIPQITQISCNGANDGRITLTPSGGDNVFTYSWSDPSIGNIGNPTGLSPGTYTVTITSCGGQQVFSSIPPLVIGAEPAAIVVNTQVQDANCEPNGVINLQVTGGQAPYTYMWNDNTLSPVNRPSNAAAGTYNLTVRDANGCATVVNGIVVGQAATGALAVTTDIVHASCSGRSDGQVSLAVNGSVSGLVCDWGALNGVISGCTPINVPSGSYTVNVSAAGGCTTPVSVVVGNQKVVSASAVVTADVCASNQGGIEIRPSGGTEPYFYTWRGTASIPNTDIATNLPKGDYMVTVTDATSCTVAIENIVVTGADAPVGITSIAQNNTDCEGDPTGSIAVDVTGGTMPYAYVWETDEGVSVPGGNAPVINNLPADVYALTVTDVNGCTRRQSYTIAANSSLDATITTTGVFPNVSATATVTGNNPPFQFIWCNGDSTMTSSNLPIGTCNLMIIDNLGCSIIRSVEVESQVLEVSIVESGAISCAGESDGILQAEPNGGGQQPYSYLWSNGATSQVVVNLGPGNYEVTITDGSNNTSTQSYTLQAPTPVDIATVSNVDDCMNDGNIEIGISGGTAPYSIAWSTGDINTTAIDSLRAGDYGVIVTDANDCTSSATLTNQPDNTCVLCYTGLEVITPNEDGRNDAFRLNCAAQAKGNVLRIFNRWGQLVYEAEGYSCTLGTEDDCWRGQNLSNRDLPKGGYFWVLEFEDVDGERTRIRDHVTILRE